ncbi:MAG: sugar ABC transporter ATP-binding protein [Candidatus Atribacteria bacterium]|nr:sugar ABC transporter ATP-binding protein [Candidatus Atribacteria bacterium]
MSFILEAKNLKKSFDGVVALSDANFTLNQGEICGLVGANGSGKTTFARIISGLIHPDSGQLYLYGSLIHLKSRLEAERLEISMVHQNLSLIPEMTVWENINLGRESTTSLGILKKEEALNKAIKALQELKVNISPYDKVSQLAPSEKQLLEIVKAFSRHPKILILDEPTASLGFKQVEILFEKLNQLRKDRVSVIFISHRIWEITKICDRIVVFRNGKTVGEVDFLQQPRDEKLIIPLITGKKENEKEKNIHEKRPYRSFESHQIVLEVDNLSKKEKLHHVSFKIREGEIVGLGGLNGQGQEEILLILSGYLKKTSGKIKMNNQEVFIKNPSQAIERGIFLVPGDRQKEGLFLNHNVFTNLIYPQVALKKQRFLLPLKDLYQTVSTAIQTISLIPPDPRKLTSHLSGGNQQKVVVGKWLSLSPKILLLNDPTKGVDIETRRNLYKIIADLSNQGVSVLLYASDNEELIANCDRVLIVFEGQIVEEICGDGICEENLIACSLRVQ